jgi:hypothetical protein
MNHAFTGASGFFTFCIVVTGVVCFAYLLGWLLTALFTGVEGRGEGE